MDPPPPLLYKNKCTHPSTILCPCHYSANFLLAQAIMGLYHHIELSSQYCCKECITIPLKHDMGARGCSWGEGVTGDCQHSRQEKTCFQGVCQATSILFSRKIYFTCLLLFTKLIIFLPSLTIFNLQIRWSYALKGWTIIQPIFRWPSFKKNKCFSLLMLDCQALKKNKHFSLLMLSGHDWR